MNEVFAHSWHEIGTRIEHISRNRNVSLNEAINYRLNVLLNIHTALRMFRVRKIRKTYRSYIDR